MSQNTLAILGIGSAVLNTVGLIPYVRDILRHKTKPERASWWIWLVLMIVSFAAQASAGATWSLFLTGALIAGNIVVAILSLNYGYGRFRQKDILALVFAMFGLVLWKITHSPLAALAIVIVVDFMGSWLTLNKSWRAPYSEDLLAWVLISSASILGFLSVGALDLTRIIFPAYLILTNWLMVALLIYRRHWRSARIKSGTKTSR